MKRLSSRLFYGIIIVGFFLVLYWVEGSGWSSQAVAQYNGGYGTFDMKTYDVHVVETVLASMKAEGYQISYRYYMGDYLFVIFYGALQCMISQMIYHSLKTRIQLGNTLALLSIIIPIVRGIADIIENTMLVCTLMRYPTINKAMIEVATIATQIKLGCIKLWGVLVLTGLIIRVILILKGKVYKKE